MKKRRTRTLRTTPWEERMIAELTSRSAFERVDRGEAEIVDPDDWSDVPHLLPPLRLPKKVLLALEEASRKEHTTPPRLAVRLLSRTLLARKTG